MAVISGLSDAERRVRAAFQKGHVVDFQTGDSEADDPSMGATWGPERCVRAEFVVALLRGVASVTPGHEARIFLRGARIVGQIDLRDADLKPPIWLERCHVEEGLDLTNASVRILGLPCCDLGPTCLSNANVGTLLDLTGAKLNGNGGPAMSGYRLTVAGDILCDGCQATGEIGLSGATIGGHLRCNGAQLNGNGGPAMSGYRLTVTGDMFCEEGFQAKGQIGLSGATIGGHLRCNGAQLNGNGAPALTADGLRVTGSILLDGGFRADGEVRLIGAIIGGHFSFSGAQLNGHGAPAMNADRLSVTGAIFCNDGFHAVGQVSFLRARVGVLVDDTESWPRRLELRGLTYDDLDPYLPARERLEWLRRSPDYGAQPYEQLAGYYRRLGYDGQARRVLLAEQRARRRQRPLWVRSWGWLQDVLVGYGYAPGRALAFLAIAFAVGWVLFHAHHPPPVNAKVHPSFNAALFTLDLLLPVPGLGQPGAWDPQGASLVVAAGLRFLGWLLAITLIAAITRTLSRN